MRNTLILLAVLVVFGGAYFLFVYNRNDSTSLDAEETAFAIQDTAVIGRVELKRLNKGKLLQSYEIKRGPNGWVDGTDFPLSQARVNSFLGTVAQLYVRDPIQDRGQQSSITLLKNTHTEARFYDLTGKEIKHYYVGPTNSPQTANVMLLEGAEHAFLVSKPAFNGYISIYFNADPNNWREKLLFNVQGSTLAEVKLEYKDGDTYEVKRSSKDSPWMLDGKSPVDQKVMEIYLDQFKGKTFAESFADEYYAGMQDSLKRLPPDAKFSYKTWDGEARTLVLYGQADNLNRYFGWMEDNKIFYTVQRAVIDKFLVMKSYFQQKGS